MVKELLLKIKHKKILEEMDKIEVSEKALTSYKYCVNNNRGLSRELLIKKLKRNFILGEKIDKYTVKYGNLHINFEGNLIKSIYNVRGSSDGLNVDNKLKEDLNIILDL